TEQLVFAFGAGRGTDAVPYDPAPRLHDRRAVRLRRSAHPLVALAGGDFTMATILERAPCAGGFSRIVRRGYRVLTDVPVIPLLILGLLAFLALFAPVLAPHGKLTPVTPTAAQCQAKFNMASCPYIDNVPPFWMR